MSKVILVNITWNPNGWRDNNYINPKAGHKYVRDSVAGESLNFDFDKKDIDSEDYIYGYFRCTNQPVQFEEGGIIIFYTTNTDKKIGQIVGIYGNANVIEEEVYDVDFQTQDYIINIEGERDFSLLFPIPINSSLFKSDSQKRMVPQVGFTYKDEEFAKKVILEELRLLEKKAILNKEYYKLKRVFENFFLIPYIEQDSDEIELKEIEDYLQKESKERLRKRIKDSAEEEESKVSINSKRYKRNNYNIAIIKKLRDYHCQICSNYILKKDASKYVEAAHITPKYLKGKEIPENIMILCPNHHKEFDVGDVEILNRTKEVIEFNMNDKNYKIDLKI